MIVCSEVTLTFFARPRLAETGALPAARRALEEMSEDLSDYQPFHAARADLARRDGDTKTALSAYDRAIALSKNEPERDWLAAQKAKV